MTHYLFYEAGSAPGVPGHFAGVRVDLDEGGAVTQTPLVRHQKDAPARRGRKQSEQPAEQVAAESEE